MDYKMLEELKENIMNELKPLSKKQSHSMSEIEAIDKMTHTIKSICGIMEKESGMSGAGRWEAQGMSYGRRYSTDGPEPYYNRGYSDRNYSYDDGREMMMSRMGMMADDPRYSDARDDIGRYVSRR